MGISSAGLGSGIDVESLITQLMKAERQPITQLQSRQSSYQSQISAFGSLKGLLSTLETASDTLSDINKLAQFSGTSSDTDIATATASSAATAGTYKIEVTQLARAHKVAFDTNFASESASVGNGKLTITAGSGTPTTIDLSTGSSRTLADVRNEINAAKAGVTATIVNVADPNHLGDPNYSVSKLVLKATDTNQTISVSATGGFSGAFGSISTVNGETARPALFKIDGLDASSNSNVVTSAIGGVTLTLKAEGTSDVTIARDSSAVKTAADAFVKAYNDVANNIKKATAYNATTKTGSVLTGDGTVRSIQSQLSNVLLSLPSTLSNTDSRLADLGISLQSDGTLKLDSTKLQSAIDKNFSGVAKSLNAYGADFESKVHSLVAFSGIIDAKTKGLQSSVTSLDKSIEALDYRMTLIEKRYRTQFSSLDVMVAQSQQTSAYLTRQLASL